MKWKLDKPIALSMKSITPTEEYTWEDWEMETATKYPIRYFLQEVLPIWFYCRIMKPIKNLFYWIRCHTYNRYHILKLQSPRYKWGWCDAVEQIMIASFTVLVNFVEKEEAFTSHIDWDSDYEHACAKNEMMELYNWWKVERWEEEKELETDCAYFAIDEKLKKKDDEMFHRLVNVRHYMWT